MDLIDARERVLHGGAFAEARAAVRAAVGAARKVCRSASCAWIAIERPPRVAVVHAARCAHGWQTAAGKWTVVAPTGIGGDLLGRTHDVGRRQINREGLLGKPPAIRTGPGLRANRHALRGERPDARTAQVPAIHLDLGERSMLDDVGLQERQRMVLGLVGRAHHGPDDQIGIDEFHHMAFVAGEQLRPRFAPMAHLRDRPARACDRRRRRAGSGAGRSSGPAPGLAPTRAAAR